MSLDNSMKVRQQTLTLLEIEREGLFEGLGLLGYGEEKAAPIKRGKRTKRPSIFDPTCTNPPASISQSYNTRAQ